MTQKRESNGKLYSTIQLWLTCKTKSKKTWIRLSTISKMISQWTYQSFISKPTWLLIILKKFKRSKILTIMRMTLWIKRQSNNLMAISSKEVTKEKDLLIWDIKSFRPRLHIKLKIINKFKMKKLKDKNKLEPLKEILLISYIVEIFMSSWLLLLKRLWKEERKLKLLMQLDIYWWENF